MRTVARYSVTFPLSRDTSNSDARPHFIPRTVFPASCTAFFAAAAKLAPETPTTSITFWTIQTPPDPGADPSYSKVWLSAARCCGPEYPCAHRGDGVSPSAARPSGAALSASSRRRRPSVPGRIAPPKAWRRRGPPARDTFYILGTDIECERAKRPRAHLSGTPVRAKRGSRGTRVAVKAASGGGRKA